MNGIALLLATTLLGVDYGWQPASDGRLEYIIQVEPITLIALREGQEVVSQIDPSVRDVRRLRIRVGSELVPRVGTPVQGTPATFSAAASAAPPGVTYGWQPVNEQQVELIVQLSPERLAALKNDPVVGEIPAELKSVARVRIRSGVGNLPRQNVPQIGLPATAGVPAAGMTSQGTRSGVPADTTRGTFGTAAAGNPQANLPPSAYNAGVSSLNGNPANVAPSMPAAGGASGSFAAGNVAGGAPSSWPTAPVGDSAPPPRYNPPNSSPALAATADPRSGYPSGAGSVQTAAPPTPGAPPQYPANTWPTPSAQNPSGQPQDASWTPAGGQNSSWATSQQASPGGQAPPMSSIASPPGVTNGQPGLSDPNGYRPWDGWSAPGANVASTQPSAPPSQPWGTADDRFTTERGQPPSFSASASPTWGQTAPTPQPSSWPTSLGANAAGATQPKTAMASPFASSSAAPERWSDISQALPERSLNASGDSVNDTVFLGEKPKKKSTDFWADLAASSQDPSLGFLREGSSTTYFNGSDRSDEPWWPLTLAMLALFASMGGNLYLGWIAVDVYRRYLEMTDDDDDDEPRESSRRREDADEWADRPRRRERAAVED